MNAQPKKKVKWELPTDEAVLEVVKRRLIADMRERWLPSSDSRDVPLDYAIDELLGTQDLRLDDDATDALFRGLERKAERAMRSIIKAIREAKL